jgi:peptidoglycan/LPS O-acetylase OafA/YrhL
MISKATSLRLAALRFPLIVGVVLIHSYSTEVTLAGSAAGAHHVPFYVTFICNFVSRGIARICVPFFFLISGYLFFQGFNGSAEVYKTKLRRRVRTLLIPFLFWNIATLLVYLLGESLPATRIYFANHYWLPIRAFGLKDYADAILGFSRKYPMSYQFWFIRDLMVMVVLTPLVYWLCKRRPIGLILLAALFANWMVGRWLLVWPNDEAMLFFVLGSFLAIHALDVTWPDRIHILTGVCFALLLLVVAWTGDHDQICHTMVCFGIPFAWWLTAIAMRHPRLQTWAKFLGATSFFVYAAHEPLLSILRKFLFKLINPQSGATQLALFFFVPISLITALVLLYGLLNRWLPRFMAVITGAEGRASADQKNPSITTA